MKLYLFDPLVGEDVAEAQFTPGLWINADLKIWLAKSVLWFNLVIAKERVAVVCKHPIVLLQEISCSCQAAFGTCVWDKVVFIARVLDALESLVLSGFVEQTHVLGKERIGHLAEQLSIFLFEHLQLLFIFLTG